ncbi:hypothetical protein ASPCADRAFT_506908 [Aspergillus carbonarius ITEM 5010]|uniref:SAM domain-containing protein n=1 Tax=Aspergillus carbonarius (strain ITEM 5010) TaxID=602072 RepID=A0A1R3RNT6_ASPC5|nr:hypothetical protein ASPCADRAFT_506908 [Aspergillus carbonarius ITEM 5010]
MNYFHMLSDPTVSDTDTTEILDTDFESDSYDTYSDDSRYLSGHSLATESVTTASTPDDVKTPDSTGLTAFHFQLDEYPVKGPVGPHLFRVSEYSDTTTSSFGFDLTVEDLSTNATSPLYQSLSRLESERKDTPVPITTVAGAHQQSEKARVHPQPKENEVADWTPQDVVIWMRKHGFDDSVIEKFFINDITGAILLELQAEDLKELEIQSFGKRHRLMGCIRELRSKASSVTCDSPSASDPISREDTSTPKTTAAEVGIDCSSPSPSTDEDKSRSKSSHHRRRRRQKRQDGTDIVPEDSVSIVAIEQLLPRIHTCSKGENCRKWQKQQAKLARLAKGLPIEGLGGSVLITGDPGNPATAQNLAKTPKSEVTPSVIASSDALGNNHAAALQLSQDKLHVVKPRDPQENVRQFLSFQRLSKLQPATDPATPPQEHFSPGAGSPGSARANATLSENLRHLPKLRIPTSDEDASSMLSPNYSAQRTITPSILQRRKPFGRQGTKKSLEPLDSGVSPSDFYRIDPYYGQSTPLSEMDVPVTAIPIGPVARNFSQSVPPDMRFGGDMHRVPDVIPRPASTRPESSRRNAFFSEGHNVQALNYLGKRLPLPPIETPEDMETTPRAAHCKAPITSNSVIHSGWMKKRKTTRFLRHDWEDHHFTLRGTQLAMYSDEETSHRDSKALEYIDVDDYAVACSSFPSNSKLTAAFKKTVLKRKDTLHGEAAFAFSLIPSPTNSTFDKKLMFTNGPKAHHFAVKTRDERIDWMRELMLAKALRKSHEGGASVNHNENFL